MINKILFFTITYFLIGFAVTAIVNKKSESNIRRQRWTKYFVYLVIVHLMLLLIWFKPFYFLIVASSIVVAGLYEIVLNYRKGPITAVRFVILSILIYSIIAFGFIRFAWQDHDQILIVYFLVIVFDGFSQLIGQLFGKRKLTYISPGKTIEGATGGFTFTLITAVLFAPTWTISSAKAIIYGGVISIASLTGDLLASWYKRKVNCKDYSNLIPGHGGVLDRFDSFIMAGAVWFTFAI